ncbi:T6SS phospholipase effector Tle1-like catalytic domain-containing protein [Culturomica massiliensis]|uniref:T6SS phospholipase effector Tle1-like catalytic domain-containing protein n=1 Tax=Culturomica massiliensis TaxID=1841857 RepID=UPI003AB5CB0F
MGTYTAQKVCCNTTSASEKSVTEVNLHIALFFDGTCNNRINSEEGENKTQTYNDALKKHPNDKKGKIPTQRNSFENDKSNIALLYENFIKLDHTATDFYCHEYIEGVATEDYLPDTLPEAAFGKYGGRGLKSKVRKGCQKIAIFINKINKQENVKIKQINFTVFGFSRGAAAARNFVYEIMREACVEHIITGGSIPRVTTVRHPKGGVLGSLLPASIPLDHIKVKYAGLFDTVSAFGIKHSNDVKELGLDAIAKADNVFQIAAIDEYRKKFELTTIESAGGKGKQLFLPGCHSDIGGGNPGTVTEKVAEILPKPPLILSSDYYTVSTLMELYDKECEAEVKRLQDEGWFAPGIIKKENGRYTGSRTVVNGYSAIPLAIMIKESENSINSFGQLENEDIPDTYNLDKTKIKVIKDAGKILLGLYNGVTNKPLEESKMDINTKLSDHLKELRREYLHISYDYVTILGAMEPRIIGGKFLREEYKG